MGPEGEKRTHSATLIPSELTPVVRTPLSMPRFTGMGSEELWPGDGETAWICLGAPMWSRALAAHDHSRHGTTVVAINSQ